MSETTTYVRTNEDGTEDTMVVTVDGDETAITYLTAGTQTAFDPAGPTGERLREYLLEMTASEGYAEQS